MESAIIRQIVALSDCKPLFYSLFVAAAVAVIHDGPCSIDPLGGTENPCVAQCWEPRGKEHLPEQD